MIDMTKKSEPKWRYYDGPFKQINKPITEDTITVEELIEVLSRMDKEAKVYLFSNNSIRSPLSKISVAKDNMVQFHT